MRSRLQGSTWRLHSVPMRIELPQPSWADAQPAQDDAHTLTLPAQRPLALPAALLGELPPPDRIGGRIEVLPGDPASLTLTL